MNTDAVLRMLIGVLGLMPTTFFLMQTLKWRGSITKVLILQISFNVLSCSAKEYMNLLSGQEVIGMTSWVLMAIYLSGVFLCFGDSLKRIILMVVIAIGCTTVAELICNAIFVNNGWLVTGSFWGVYDYVRDMRDHTFKSDPHGNGFPHKVETVSVPRKKPDSHSTDRSQRSRRNVSLHGLYFEKAACGFYRSAVPFYPDHYDLHVPPAHRSGDRKTSGK